MLPNLMCPLTIHYQQFTSQLLYLVFYLMVTLIKTLHYCFRSTQLVILNKIHYVIKIFSIICRYFYVNNKQPPLLNKTFKHLGTYYVQNAANYETTFYLQPKRNHKTEKYNEAMKIL